MPKKSLFPLGALDPPRCERNFNTIILFDFPPRGGWGNPPKHQWGRVNDKHLAMQWLDTSISIIPCYCYNSYNDGTGDTLERLVGEGTEPEQSVPSEQVG